jgi:hypothetical protein
MAKFLVLARGGGPAPDRSPADIQKVIAKYRDWTDRVRSAGRLLEAEKLRPQDGRVLRGRAGQPLVTDGPYTESKEVVGGYWLIEASAYDEVVDLLRAHPLLELGGALEVRQIEQMGPRG